MNARAGTRATDTATAIAMLDPDVVAQSNREDTLAIYQELIEGCQPKPFTAADWDKGAPTPVEKAAEVAYAATKDWMSLYEQQRADRLIDMGPVLQILHKKMREAHSIHCAAIEIEEIGRLEGGREIRPGYSGYDLEIYDSDSEDPLLTIPRGLGRATVLLLLQTWDRAFDEGERMGNEMARAKMVELVRSL